MAWYTTKSGKRVNTDWFDKDRQIELNKTEADTLNVEEKKETLRQKVRQLKKTKQEFIHNHFNQDTGELESGNLDDFLALDRKLNENTFELHRLMPMTINDSSKWDTKTSAITKQEADTVRADMLKSKDMYMAMAEARTGVSYEESGTKDTPVDALYKKSPKEAYAIFEPTRQMLSNKYGDSMTLYRVPTSATNKTTINMTSTKYNASRYEQVYGTKTEKIDVPIKDILAVNITRTGGYEEFIVLNRKKR